MNTCPYCQREVPESAQVCPHCGAILSKEQAPALEQPASSVSEDDKVRRQKYWGLGLVALGLILELLPFLKILPTHPHDDTLATWSHFIGVYVSMIGLVLYAKTRGRSTLWCLMAWVPVIGPILGMLGIAIGSRVKDEKRTLLPRIQGEKRYFGWSEYLQGIIIFGIIGFFGAIAVPNFTNYGAPPQSKAKTGLGGIFTAATSMKAERGTFVISDISQLGYESARTPRYSFWYSVNGVPTMVPGGKAKSPCDGPPTTVRVAASATGFTAAAKGNIDNDATCDEWSINDARNLTNTLSDLAR